MSTNNSPTASQDNISMTSNQMTMKQYVLVNLSKFIVEIVGTAVLSIFYLTVAEEQTGMLLGYWIITLFALAISGAHFNPAVTLVIMLRKNSTFGSRRLLGILYIVAQFLGGLLGAFVSLFLMFSSGKNNIAISPAMVAIDA